jgi:hypothetical protein
MQILRLLLVFFIFYYLVKFLRNLYNGAFNGKSGQKGTSAKRTGSVTIDYIPPKQKRKVSKEEAESIDFEEIK